MLGNNPSIEEIRKSIRVDPSFYQALKDLIKTVRIQAPKLKNFKTLIFDRNIQKYYKVQLIIFNTIILFIDKNCSCSSTPRA